MKPTLHRLAAFVLGGMIAAASAHAAPSGKLEREEKFTVSATGKKELTIENARGRTVIVGRPDAKTVSIVAIKAAMGRDEADAEAMIEKLSCDISEHGDKIVVETRDGNRWDDGSWTIFKAVKGSRRLAWIDYTIEVPYSFDLSAATTSGEIRLSNVGGKAEVAATSGDVNVHGVAGDLTARLTSGDLESVDIGGNLSVSATSGNVVIDNVKGKLDVDGTSGDFHASRIGSGADIQLVSGDFVLEGCTGDVSFRASSGDATLTEIDGAVDASTSSGDISALIIPVGGRVFRLSASSGDIDVYYLPVKDYGFALDVQTSSGSIECDLPIRVSRVERRRLQGTVGTAAAKLQIETASGDVGIVEKSEAATKTGR
jgi:DUF4097 and DUF4098 domain-containing protein YvlB